MLTPERAHDVHLALVPEPEEENPGTCIFEVNEYFIYTFISRLTFSEFSRRNTHFDPNNLYNFGHKGEKVIYLVFEQHHLIIFLVVFVSRLIVCVLRMSHCMHPARVNKRTCS